MAPPEGSGGLEESQTMLCAGPLKQTVGDWALGGDRQKRMGGPQCPTWAKLPDSGRNIWGSGHHSHSAVEIKSNNWNENSIKCLK